MLIRNEFQVFVWPFLCVLNVNGNALVKKYEEEQVEQSEFDANVIRPVSNVRTLMTCAAICSKDGTCDRFKYDQDQTCTLSAREEGFCAKPYSAPITPVDVYVEAAGRQKLGQGEAAFVYNITTAEEKSAWFGDQSSSDTDDKVALYAIDGNPAEGYHAFHSNSGEAGFAWFQVEMDREHWVKGVILHQRGFTERNEYKEVRVGNTDVGGSGQDKLLCQNQLCFTTGKDGSALNRITCATPLKGRFITVQNYGHSVDQVRINEANEIDIEVYCGAFLPDDGTVCIAEEVDSCARVATGSEVTVKTAGDKSGWVGKSSSQYQVSNGPLEAKYAINGDYTTAASTPRLFSTKSPKDEGDFYPWMQIDFGVEKRVKAVHLYSRTDVATDGSHYVDSEIRVGNTDVSLTPLGTKICANALCKTTGPVPTTPHLDDCASPPIKGRYVTIQRMPDGGDTHTSALSIGEVDVVFIE